jgi:hypothetical protein
MRSAELVFNTVKEIVNSPIDTHYKNNRLIEELVYVMLDVRELLANPIVTSKTPKISKIEK